MRDDLAKGARSVAGILLRGGSVFAVKRKPGGDVTPIEHEETGSLILGVEQAELRFFLGPAILVGLVEQDVHAALDALEVAL